MHGRASVEAATERTRHLQVSAQARAVQRPAASTARTASLIIVIAPPRVFVIARRAQQMYCYSTATWHALLQPPLSLSAPWQKDGLDLRTAEPAGTQRQRSRA